MFNIKNKYMNDLVLKCKKVITSVETLEQARVAFKFLYLAREKTRDTEYSTYIDLLEDKLIQKTINLLKWVN